MTIILNLANKQKYISFLQEAIYALKNGKIIAFPTETVYGLGANAEDHAAVLRLYEIKQRPIEKKLTILIANSNDINLYVYQVPIDAQKLINRFWPGPLTLVLQSKKGGDIGVRVPRHKVINDLLSMSKIPIAAPSANISGQSPKTDANSVFEAFKGKIDIVLDYGTTPLGKASTVVRVNNHATEILRHGAITDKEIYDCLAL